MGDGGERAGAGGAEPWSEELLEAVLETAPDFIVTVDLGGTILYVNRVLPELSRRDVVGKTVFEFVDRAWLPDMREAIARIVKTGEPQSFQVRGIGPGGQMTTYFSRMGPIVRDGAVAALTLIATDVGELIRAQEALRQSEQKLRLAVGATGMGVWSWDAADDVVSWDDVMCHHYGIAREQAPATYEAFRELVYPSDRAAVIASIGRAVETGVYGDIEHRVELPDGSIRWLLIKGDVERGEDGAVKRLLGGVFDITERRRLDEKMRQAQKMEAIGQLAAGVAHNFNNTLTSVLSGLQLSARKAPPDLRPGLVDAIEAARGAAKVVQQLVELAGGPGSETREMVAVERSVERVVRMCRRTFDRSVALELQSKANGVAAMINRSQVEQALLNLCINARDAISAARVSEPRIQVMLDTVEIGPGQPMSVAAAPAGRYVRIRVADNGKGIDPETRERIFEPFFTTKEEGGSGLGLATAHATVVEHGGWLDCDSTPGKGTVFSIFLPAGDDDADLAESDRGVAVAPVASGTLLLVDDEELVRSTVARLLEYGGYSVLQAGNGREAIELFERRAHEIDLVLLDHSMPGMSGRDVLARLLELDPSARIVMFTGYAPAANQYPGAAAVIGKPADEAVLFATLREVVRR